MRRLFRQCINLLCSASSLWLTADTRAQDLSADSLTDEHVQKAIHAIVDELYARKQPNLFWEPRPYPSDEERQDTGYTALTVWALLWAGESYQSSKLRDAIEYLEQAVPDGTYARAVRAAVWAQLPNKYLPMLEADTQWLLDAFSKRARGWGYRMQPGTKRLDNSINRWGTLALREAQRRGIDVPKSIWKQLEQRAIETQIIDGGWNYDGTGPPTGSMTTSGLVTLFITQDVLHAEDALNLRARDDEPHERALRLGLEWMNTNFSALENPGRDTDFYYYLFTVERVGHASGYKSFAGHDWFRHGAAELIRRLCNWNDADRTMTVHERVGGSGRAGKVRTRYLAFALMYLSQGRVPIAVHKLKDDETNWNNRPRDVANLTAWIGEESESRLAWQIIDVETDPQRWLDAPMVYLASNQALPWLARGSGDDDADLHPTARAMQQYLESGGLLFAVNEARSAAFSRSVVQTAQKMFPNFHWRRLPDDHWSYNLHHQVEGRKPALEGLTNGVRELIILAPKGDLSGSFQARMNRNPQHAQIAGNIYLYASEMNRPPPRLGQNTINVSREKVRLSERELRLARASHDGNWNAEPEAFDRFKTFFKTRYDCAVRIRTSSLVDLADENPQPHVVFINGVTAHELTTDEQNAIRELTASGTVCVFETVGGLGGFASHAEQRMSALYSTPAEPLLRHPIVTGTDLPGGFDQTNVDYRPMAVERFGTRDSLPRLRGIKADGKLRLIFSDEDISHGLLDQPCWGVSGYTAESANRLLTNICLFAVGASTPPDAGN